MSTKIKELDRFTTEYVMECLENLLKPLGDKIGVSLTLGKCQFRSTNARFQVKLSVLDVNGEPITEEAEFFKQNAHIYGFHSTDLGREFSIRGQVFTISGLNPQGRKYPVLAKNNTGEEYKFACQTVFGALLADKTRKSNDAV